MAISFQLNNNTKLWLILFFAFLLRFPGVFWGELWTENLDVLEPDEHVHLAISIEFMQKLDASLFEDYHPERLNVPGYGVQLGLLGLPFMKILNSDYKVLLILSRLLSILYALALIFITYKISCQLFQNKSIGLWAALLLSIFDLNVTYSHYGIPDIPYVFWAYFSLFIMLKFFKGIDNQSVVGGMFSSKRDILMTFCLALSLGFTLAFRLDFVPILVFTFAIVYVFRKKPILLFRSWKFIASLILLTILFFEIGIGFQNQKLVESFIWLFEENSQLIEGNWHYVYNPLLYLIGIVCGVGLSIIPLIIKGLKELYNKRRSDNIFAFGMMVLLVFILLEFLVRWRMDATFIRRCNIFLPFIALVAAYGIHHFLNNPKGLKKSYRYFLISTAIGYCLVLTLVSQSNFIFDNRYEIKSFMNQQDFENTAVYYSPYAKIKNLSGKQISFDKAEILVIHESYYSRYWKTFTTPFQIPKCCNGVYHCLSEKECEFYQKILSGHKNYKLLYESKPIDIFPERLLYKKAFGTFETFLGDVKVFQKIN